MANHRTGVISKAGYDAAMEWLDAALGDMKVKREEILTAQLLTEETFLRLAAASGDAEAFSARLTLQKRLGDVTLTLAAPGEACNPIVEMDDVTEDEAAIYGLALLKAHRKALSYARKQNENRVIIRVHEYGGKGTRNMLAGLVLGAFFGVLAREFIDPAALLLLEQNLLTPVQKIIMNALKMLLAPLVFFSVMSGFSSVSDAADIARYGRNLMLISLAKLAMVVAAAMVIGVGLGAAPAFLPLLRGGAAPPVTPFSTVDILVEIVPDNLVSGFSDNNLLQVMFLACFFGLLLSRAGERAAWARQMVDFFRGFLAEALAAVTPFIPLMVGASIMKLTMGMELSALLGYGKILLAAAIVIPLSLVVSALWVMVAGRVSPVPFVKKILPFSVAALSLQSSNACIPPTMKFCAEKLGMDGKLSLFSIPVGIQFNKNGTGIYLACTGLVISATLGMPLDTEFLLSFFFAVFIVTLSVPAVPNAEVIALAAIFDLVGIPAEAAALLFAVSPLMPAIDTTADVTGNVASSFITQRWGDRVNKAKYDSD